LYGRCPTSPILQWGIPSPLTPVFLKAKGEKNEKK